MNYSVRMSKGKQLAGAKKSRVREMPGVSGGCNMGLKTRNSLGLWGKIHYVYGLSELISRY